MPASSALLFLRSRWKVVLALLWLSFCLSLTAWWIVFGLRQIDRLAALDHLLAPQLIRQQRMLVSEGAILAFSLVAGGIALLYYTYLESQKRKAVQTFFAAFTHDLKTSLASLRVQADALKEELIGMLSPGSIQEILFSRLLKDTVRLELQLENSLLMSSDSDHRFYLETVELIDLLENVHLNWPDLNLKIQGQATLFCDRRALQIIFKNIFQNAITHGKAAEILVNISQVGSRIRLMVQDDGRGFSGNQKDIGHLFQRHSSTSGSGVGLYVIKDLTQRLKGSCEFFPQSSKSTKGFAIQLEFPKLEPTDNDMAKTI